ncbi:MAG: AAA family ATPase [Bdellovibrionota bacterium]
MTKDTISIISANPYRLIDEIRGVGFLSADKIARSLGIDPTSEERMLAAITYLLAQAEEEGHCFLFEEQLKSRLEELIKVVIQDYSIKFDNCITLLQTTNTIVKENIIDKGLNLTRPAYYLGNLFLAEVEVVSKIKDMLNGHANITRQNNEILEHRIQSWINKFTKKKGIQLTEKQILAVIQAAQSKIFILTGGPGVGKTTAADTIIRLLKAMSKSVSLAAPTGRAAQRLSEVSALPAKTVHRLLEWNGSDGNFEKNSINQIESDVIIIDEASMLDINLTHKLFSALRNSSQLILIGDTDQLPSIGPGNVLRDLIASKKITCCELDEVFRQSEKSRIIQSAHAINKGQLPDFSNEAGSDCRFITAESNASIKATIEDLILNKLPAAGYNQFNDIQILTPMNRGELGTINLNEQLQNIINPINDNEHEYKVNKQRFLIGDKVIQCVNNYELGVFNGDIGFIEHVRANGAKLIVKFNERLVNYSSEQASELKLAYAITIHKSQGSEFPAVIIPITMQHYIMLQRNLIYTALTRAKKLAIFIGSKKALQYAAQNQTSHTRQTRLKEKLEI